MEVDRTARDGADHFADHIGLGRTGILDVTGLDPDAQARVDEAVRSVVEQVEQLCGDVVVARQALVVGERTGVEIGLVILRAAGELHGGVVVVRLEDGVFARVGDDLVDLLADRGGEGVVTAAHAHQQTQAQRVGEFLWGRPAPGWRCRASWPARVPPAWPYRPPAASRYAGC